MDHWENLASRPLYWRRFALGVAVLVLSLLVVLPSAGHAIVEDPVLVALQGSLMCTGIGLLVSRWAGYATQASIAFLYALLSLNASRALDEQLAWLLAIGGKPSSQSVLLAGTVAGLGCLIQATRSSASAARVSTPMGGAG